MAVKRSPSQAETRQLLLDAAGAVFAEHGYRDTTVREICQRAGTNIAAVNYHFGDKEHLYLEVLRYSHGKALEKFPPDWGSCPTDPPAARLRAYVRSSLFRLFDVGPTSWHGKLITMEMIHPTRALDALVEERFRPMSDQLAGIVRELLGEKAGPEMVRFCGASVVSQCVFYHHCRSVVSRLYPEQKFGSRDLERLVEHITEFSLAGINQLARKSGRTR